MKGHSEYGQNKNNIENRIRKNIYLQSAIKAELATELPEGDRGSSSSNLRILKIRRNLSAYMCVKHDLEGLPGMKERWVCDCDLVCVNLSNHQ